ncbi:ankyrin repeat-containing domain protein [Flagelloscypha sp. PMI_526]|nr:ankyrin repeat-containing domain protein [Flagelloscypha sp. PMI_526]
MASHFLCVQAISLRLSHLAESILEAPQPSDVLDAALHTLAAAADGFERFCGTGVAIDLGTKLLNNGANINSRSPNSIYPTPLQASRSPRFLQFLIDAGADVDDIGGDSGPALEFSSVLEQTPTFKAPGIQRGPPLHTASEQLDVDMVSLLLRFDADSREMTKDEEGLYPFFLKQQLSEVTGILLTCFWTLEHPFRFKWIRKHQSILHGAVITRGNSESVLLRFVHAGANVNARSTEYGTPLQLAAEIASIQVVRTLIEAGADLVAAPGPSGSAIEIAIRANRPDVVQLLVTKGVSANSLVNTLVEKRINIEEQEGGSLSEDVAGWIFRVDPSEDVSKNPNSTTVLALLELGADPNAPSNVHGSALQAVIEGAAAEGYGDVLKIHYASNVATIRLDITQQLVNAGAIPDAKCLHTAALMDDIDLVKLFIATGTNINAKSDEPYGNALQAAVVGRSAAIVQLLLQAGADINIECGTYGSTLGAAIALHVHEIIPLLLCHKPDVNIPISTSDRPIPGNNLGGPPLVVAAGHRLFEDSSILEDLLTAGADINATGPNGSALGTAIMAEKDEFVSIPPSKRSRYNHSTYLGSANVVEMLLKAGADINFTASSSDSHGSPLGEAVAEGEIEIVRILLQHWRKRSYPLPYLWTAYIGCEGQNGSEEDTWQ